MKRLLLLAAIAGCATEPSAEPETPAFRHDLWTKVLKAHCRDGLVDYAALKEDRADLDAYLALVAKDSPDANPAAFPRREDRLAYAINAYNAWALKGVLDHYPCDSVKSIGERPFDFFKKLEFTFGGKKSSLEAWETKARQEFGDPRLHFALNCASIGCPKLPEEAFEPARLEDQLARETKKFLGEERNVRVADGVVTLSSIFKWYRKDFGTEDQPANLEAWLRAQGVEFPEGAEIRFADYDWGLNDRKGGR
ncbi:MAG: DUF547 domain-containing protein [Planctomycetia bacterium]|nr:DUF547 domain-containing protein [Planctomycetia bacterium]